jgi:hypothetical protein
MTIGEMNKGLPAHFERMKEEQHINNVLRFEARGVVELQAFKDNVRKAFEAAKQEFTTRYMDPAEEYYGRGMLADHDVLIYLFPCVTLRDYERLKYTIEITRGITSYCAGMEITKL